MSGVVVELTDGNFSIEVLESKLPVLVDFWAEWCMPCKMLAPIIEQTARQFADRVKVGKLDTDANRDVSIEYEITAIPTVMLFKGGQVVKRFVGLMSQADLAEALERYAD